MFAVLVRITCELLIWLCRLLHPATELHLIVLLWLEWLDSWLLRRVGWVLSLALTRRFVLALVAELANLACIARKLVLRLLWLCLNHVWLVRLVLLILRL